jgi:hypothetical protein
MKHLILFVLLIGNILGQSAFAGSTDFCKKEDLTLLLQTPGDLITIDDTGTIIVNKQQVGVDRSKIHNEIIEIKSSYMTTYIVPGFGGASNEVTINVYRSAEQKLERIERIVPIGEPKTGYDETSGGPHRVEGILCYQDFKYVERFPTAPTPQDLKNALHQAYHKKLHRSEVKEKLKQNYSVDKLREKLSKRLSDRAARAERIESSDLDLVSNSSGNAVGQPTGNSKTDRKAD